MPQDAQGNYPDEIEYDGARYEIRVEFTDGQNAASFIALNYLKLEHRFELQTEDNHWHVWPWTSLFHVEIIPFVVQD